VKRPNYISRKPCLVLILLSLLLAAGTTSALPANKPINQYIHTVWHSGDGWTQRSAQGIGQTPDGYLWIATEEGLMRFDGVRFTLFDSHNTPAIARDDMRTLLVDVAANGREAVRMTERQWYDIVFMDCEMPEMDGYEATRRIREKEGLGGGHLPIVAMTANAMKGDREKCLAAGMDAYLAKPVRKREIAEMLEIWLESFVSQ